LLPLPECMACKELAHPKILQHDLQQWLWRHLDCYNLWKVWILLKGRVLIVHLSTRKNRIETLVAHLSYQNFNIWPTKCIRNCTILSRYSAGIHSQYTCRGMCWTCLHMNTDGRAPLYVSKSAL
jgi:hypothetical protein